MTYAWCSPLSEHQQRPVRSMPASAVAPGAVAARAPFAGSCTRQSLGRGCLWRRLSAITSEQTAALADTNTCGVVSWDRRRFRIFIWRMVIGRELLQQPSLNSKAVRELHGPALS